MDSQTTETSKDNNIAKVEVEGFYETYQSLSLSEQEKILDKIAGMYAKLFSKKLKLAQKGKL